MARRTVETEKYVFEMWSEPLIDVVRVNVRLTRDEQHRRGNNAVSIKEIAEQLRNIEKWEALKQAKRLISEILRE